MAGPTVQAMNHYNQAAPAGGQSSQYEYSIEGNVDHMRQHQPAPSTQTQSSSKGSSVGAKNAGSNSLPKRTPHSELTSYQSEKRLKEYKQQQAQLQQPLPQVAQINANSRQQFIIEEEGAYSQRSSDEESNAKNRQPVLQNVNNYNTNSQLNLSKKSSHPNGQHTKQNTFSYGNAAQTQNDAMSMGKTNSRNGPRGESFHEIGAPGGSNFNGDTGHDYNI